MIAAGHVPDPDRLGSGEAQEDPGTVARERSRRRIRIELNRKRSFLLPGVQIPDTQPAVLR